MTRTIPMPLRPKASSAPSPAPHSARPARQSSLLRVTAVAERLDVSTRHVRRLIAAGSLPVHRIGRSVRIAEDDLEHLLRQARQ